MPGSVHCIICNKNNITQSIKKAEELEQKLRDLATHGASSAEMTDLQQKVRSTQIKHARVRRKMSAAQLTSSHVVACRFLICKPSSSLRTRSANEQQNRGSNWRRPPGSWSVPEAKPSGSGSSAAGNRRNSCATVHLPADAHRLVCNDPYWQHLLGVRSQLSGSRAGRACGV